MKYVAYAFVGGIAVAVAVWLSDRVGGKVGGIVATSPTVVLVAYVLFCSTHGAARSSVFAVGAVKGLVATGVFMLTLALLPGTFGLVQRLAIALAGWLVAATALAFLPFLDAKPSTDRPQADPNVGAVSLDSGKSKGPAPFVGIGLPSSGHCNKTGSEGEIGNGG